MKVMVKTIPASGLEFTRTVSPESIGLMHDDLNCVSPLEVTAKIERIQNVVVANVDVRGKYSFICSRCLSGVDHDDVSQFKFEYLVNLNTVSIDLGEDIRQEIILDLPVRVLCREDCKGFCPGCGINLNKEQCKCKKEN